MSTYLAQALCLELIVLSLIQQTKSLRSKRRNTPYFFQVVASHYERKLVIVGTTNTDTGSSEPSSDRDSSEPSELAT